MAISAGLTARSLGIRLRPRALMETPPLEGGASETRRHFEKFRKLFRAVRSSGACDTHGKAEVFGNINNDNDQNPSRHSYIRLLLVSCATLVFCPTFHYSSSPVNAKCDPLLNIGCSPHVPFRLDLQTAFSSTTSGSWFFALFLLLFWIFSLGLTSGIPPIITFPPFSYSAN